MSWPAEFDEHLLSSRAQFADFLARSRIVILAAHPDDETIGASVVLTHCANPFVIFLTDGAPRDSRLWPPHFIGSQQDYAQLRRNEAARALSYCGITGQQIAWLGAVDQESVFLAAELVRRLRDVLRQQRSEVLVTHSYEGGHPDHDTAALIAGLALAHLKLQETPILVEMTSYHARNDRCVTGEFLNGDPAREVCFDLQEIDCDRKRQMFGAYASQRLVLESFPTSHERFRKAPKYDFSFPPHEGKLWYECMGWAVTGERWREAAMHATAEVPEASCR